MFSKKYKLILLLLPIYISFGFSVPKNLIVRAWACEVNEYSQNAFVINDAVSYVQLIQKAGCAGNQQVPLLNAADFTKYTVLCLYDNGQAFCHANYYRQVVYYPESKKYVYSHITNGVGGCKHMAIPLLQFVLIPKVKDQQFIKFRYLYQGNSNGKELSKKDAKKLLNEDDHRFVIITNNKM